MAHLALKAPPRLVVLVVRPQVLRQVQNAGGEKRYLDFGGTGVGRVLLIFLNDLLGLLLLQPYLARLASSLPLYVGHYSMVACR